MDEDKMACGGVCEKWIGNCMDFSVVMIGV
jgi:hypothetical protein